MAGNRKKSGKGRYFARYISHYTKKNYTLIGLGLFFLSGVLAGAIFMGSAAGETRDLLNRMVNGFVDSRQGQAFVEIFTSSAFSSLIFIGLLFICGFCAVFQPVEIVMPFFKGLGFGVMAASLYGGYGTGAAAYIGILMLPGLAISTVAMLFCCRESIKLSGSFFSRMRGGDGNAYPLRLYTARFFIAALACLLSAFTEASLHAMFAKFIFLR